MALRAAFRRHGTFYDPDDPDNYLDRPEGPEHSRLVSWIIAGMLGAAVIVGLFFAEESPLIDRPTTQTTENVSPQTAPPPALPN